MTQQIVFVGNCQARSLSLFYKEYLADPVEDHVTYIDIGPHVGKEKIKILERANIVAFQDFEFPSEITSDEIPATIKVVHFPVVTCRFLWPFFGRQHPKNQATSFYAGGPFPPGLSDSFLNKLIAKGVSADEAVDQYLSVNFKEITNLDRLYEMSMDSQRKRDTKAGMFFADMLEEHFRDESLFVNFGHPRMRIFTAMAQQVFGAMGVSQKILDDALAMLVSPPFPDSALPIHPAIGRHFGLRYVSEETKYPFNYLGPITFVEYVRRYMEYDWNPELHEGIWLAGGVGAGLSYGRVIGISGGREPERALNLIDSGLGRSPASSFGQRARSIVLMGLGRSAEAREAAEHAAELNLSDPDNLLFLARLNAELGDHAKGISLASEIINKFPNYPLVHQVMAHIEFAAGNLRGALSSSRRAVQLSPGNSYMQGKLGHFLLACGEFEDAEYALRKAVSLGAASPSIVTDLVQAISSQGRLEIVIAGEIDKFSAAPERFLTNFLNQLLRRLAQHGDLKVANALTSRAVAVAPSNVNFLRTLADICFRQALFEEACQHYRTAMKLHPDHGPDHVQSALALVRMSDLDAAEQNARHAMAIAPSLPGGYFALAHILAKRNRFDEAVEASKRGVLVQPNNPLAFMQLGGYENMRGQIDQARQAFKRAVELAPQSGPFRRSFAKALGDAGDIENAIVQAKKAIELDGHALSIALLEMLLLRRKKSKNRKCLSQSNRHCKGLNLTKQLREWLREQKIIGR